MNLQGRDLRLELDGDDVRLLQTELAQIGLPVPEDERGRGFFGHGTFQAVTRFQAEQRLERTGVVDAETARAINRAVDASTYTVAGTVSSPDRAGVGGLRVEIVDRNVGEDVGLAEAITDELGRYNARFASRSLRERGKSEPDLQARVYAGETFLAASDIRYNARTEESLNVELPADSAALPSEHETLTEALAAYYGGELGELKESDDRQDITYLGNKIEWDVRAVAFAALADQFGQHTTGGEDAEGIPPAFYYALFRAGLPANPDTLYQADAQTIERVWKQAIEHGVIPVALEQELPKAMEAFQALGAARALDSQALAGTSTLKEMLRLALGDDAQRQNEFAELYTRGRDDPPAFWDSVRQSFGEETASRLQLDGQLGYLTLNNAPLIRSLRDAEGQNPLASTLELVQRGYHRAEQWEQLLDSAVPEQIPGDSPGEKRANYAELLAAQVRLGFPTAVVAEMVSGDENPLNVAPDARDDVHAFLTEHQGEFEIGMHPVEQYLARNDLQEQIAAPVREQIKRLQRVYQITPDDQAMSALLQNGLDSAYQVVGYDEAEFVQNFKDDFGGEENARLTYAKSQQVHNAVLNVAGSYLTARGGPALGSDASALIIDPAPNGQAPPAANASDVVAYPTLEDLFGSMDYCACEHCRSILSPAAYLVHLLRFIDPPVNGGENPLTVLLERRPDIEHLPLTCENTNTPIPYIDVVNETLEHFVANDLSLTDYTGHDTDDSANAEELLASPQFVNDAAYDTLKTEFFPPALPFHRALETLRRYFDTFGIPLQEAMEALRVDDAVERASATSYGWRDVLMEQLKLSRAEYALLTDRTLTLRQLYGYAPGTSDAEALADLSNVKAFARRVGVTYEDAIELLKTRFVNPNSTLIPRLERLRVPFSTLKELKDGAISDADFDALLPAGLDPADYGGDIKAWVKDDANHARIMGLITIANPANSADLCSFDKLEFRYANPDNDANALRAIEYVRLLRFIRLWKKLGWTIGQTDKAITALYPAAELPTGADDDADLQRLDRGFLTLLPRLGIAHRIMDYLNLRPERDLPGLLALWAPIDTHGAGSLYRQMFGSPALLKQDPAFAGDGYGNFLQRVDVPYTHPHPTLGQAVLDAAPPGGIAYDDFRKRLSYTGVLSVATRDALKAVAGVSAGFRAAVDALYAAQRLLVHSETLRAAFGLSGEEFSLIAAALDVDADTPLTLENISAVYRRGWLARKLGLSVREFLLLSQYTDLDPFAAPDPPAPPVVRLIELVKRLRAASLKPGQALYLIWNEDINGKSAPSMERITGLARTLRVGCAEIESQFAVSDDPTGETARTRMALVYGNDATDFFFGLLNSTSSVEVPYSHPRATLERSIVDTAQGRIGYDDLRKRLSYAGVLSTATRDALGAVTGVTQEFKSAVDALYAANQAAIEPFFARYQELLPLFSAYAASADPPEKKRTTLLAGFLPELKKRRKAQQALATLGADARIDDAFARAILEEATVLHAAGDETKPALDDLTASETPGLSARFFWRDTATGDAGLSVVAAPTLAYSGAGPHRLPPHPMTPGDPISGIWSGFFEAPESGFYNIAVETDEGANVALTLGGDNVALAPSDNVWSNQHPISLTAGTLHPIVLKAEGMTSTLTVRWETTGRGWEVIPARYLYAATLVDHLRTAYVRFLKAASLATGLSLTANEIAHFAAHADYRIGGRGWLNALPVSGSPDASTSRSLREVLAALLDFARIKAALAPDDERLLSVLKDPAATLPNGEGELLSLTRWEGGSLNTLLARFGKSRADLAHLDTFRRVYDAYALIRMFGISASALGASATNEPDAATVRDLQSALRARYDEADWLDVLRPINDALRELRRDALVAHVLRKLGEDPDTRHIDTPDKLFEHFLMDVQMDPCMQTSRIRHALSSVQLFIERCLMNLEPRVAPSSIKANQWEWMKRYRVWEANRKVFLWPENWLEPELRDDQSPIFKETMSELLQSDITEDAAATALLNYLSKLDEVAKLEPCGIHYVENDSGTADDVAHVVARTAGAHRKYYYRRREYGGWTPWEKINLDIEDNPVIPVVWRGRLFLFWLRILKQAPLVPPPPRPPGGVEVSGPLASLSPGQLRDDAQQTAANSKVTVQAVLCWSEYYNGKWQPTKTSDVDRPTGLGEFLASGSRAFDRSKLLLSVREGPDGLLVSIFGQGTWSSFLLYNTHSLPVREEDIGLGSAGIFPPWLFRSYRSLSTSTDDTFSITYDTGIRALYWGGAGNGLDRSTLVRDVLTNTIDHRTVEARHDSRNVWDAPFLFEDSRHVFYVNTSERLVTVPQYAGYGVAVRPSPRSVAEIPPLVLRRDPRLGDVPDKQGPILQGVDPGVADPSPIERFVTEDANIRIGIGTSASVRYAGRDIGPAGALPDRQMP